MGKRQKFGQVGGALLGAAGKKWEETWYTSQWDKIKQGLSSKLEIRKRKERAQNGRGEISDNYRKKDCRSFSPT